MTYSVNVWGSNPEDGNDDCWYGYEFDTREDAMFSFANMTPSEACDVFVEVDGPDINDARRINPDPKPDNSARNEWTMQQGMAHGCEGFNDAMGY